MRTPEWLNWDLNPNNLYDSINHKYKYTYGIKDIQIKNKRYDSKSIYVSKPITLDGSIGSVSLFANDENVKRHDSEGINPYETSIEYYITFDDYEWTPILPCNKDKVDCELLMFLNDSSSSVTRFPIDNKKPVSVFKNGIKLDGQYWRKDINNDGAKNNKIKSSSYLSIGDKISIAKGYDKYSTYTISYTPDVARHNAKEILISNEDYALTDYVGEDGKDGELFVNGTDRNGSITLSKFPYVDKQKELKNKTITNEEDKYRPVEVSLENSNIAIYGGKIETYVNELCSRPSNVLKVKNITDYQRPDVNKEKIINKYDITYENGKMKYPYLEYLQLNNKLYFSETFNNTSITNNAEINHGDSAIRVKYKYLDTHVRLKIILRNISRSSHITPVVKDYQLIFNLKR